MKRYLAWVVGVGVIGGCLGWVFAAFSTKLYDARTTLQVETKAAAPADSSGAALAVLFSPAIFHTAYESVDDRVKQGQTAEGSLRSTMTAQPLSKGAVIELRTVSSNPQLSADLANQLVRAYSAKAIAANRVRMADRTLELSSQVNRTKQHLDAVQKSIAQYKQSLGIVNLDQSVQQVATYLQSLTEQRNRQAADLAGSLLQAKQIKASIRAMPATTINRTQRGPNPQLKALNDRLTALQNERVSKLATFLETSKVITAIDAQIAAVQKAIANAKYASLSVESQDQVLNPARVQLQQTLFSVESQIAGDETGIKAIDSALAKAKLTNADLPKAEAKMTEMERERKLAEDKYGKLRDVLDALAVNGVPGDLPVLSEVVPILPSSTPCWPEIPLIMGIGGAIGLCVGLIGAIATAPAPEPAGAFAQTISGPALPISTTAPPLPMGRKEGLSILALPGRAPAEAYRFMVFSLQAKGDHAARSILFTGVSSDALASEASAQFAIAMSETGVRTILADCNLRSPQLTDAFGFMGKSGISDVLSRTLLPTPGNDLLLETSHASLYFLPAGTEKTESIGGFPNIQVAGLLAEYDDKADCRILNAPPCTVVSDAPRLAKYVDQVCLVASKQDKSRGLVQKATDILRLAGAKHIEVVLIDAHSAKGSFLG